MLQLEVETARSASGDNGDGSVDPSARARSTIRAPAMRRYTAEELKAAVLAKLTYTVGKNPVAASQRDWFLAVAHATRDIIVERWIELDQRHLRRTTASGSIICRSNS